MLKIIHTGDVHIGVKFGAFGEKAPEQRKALLDVFAKIVDTAISEKAHLVLIAGDLFDSNVPSHASVAFVKSQLKRLNTARVYTAILPGTHDCLAGNSIYLKEDFARDMPHIYVFNDPETTTKAFPEINVTVFGKANTSNKSSKSPVAFLQEAGAGAHTAHKVAMAHGSVQIQGKSAPDDTPIAQNDIAKSGMDYVALGHWHGTQDFSSGGTAAWYCGSPEITYQEGKGGLGQGNILIVEISDGNAKVTARKVSEKECTEARIDMRESGTMEDVYREITALESPHRVLTVTLFGLVSPDVFIDTRKIEEDFASAFFSIRVKNDTTVRIAAIAEKTYPQELVIGQFARIMREKFEQTEDEQEKQVIADALHLGIAELEGKNVLE